MHFKPSEQPPPNGWHTAAKLPAATPIPVTLIEQLYKVMPGPEALDTELSYRAAIEKCRQAGNREACDRLIEALRLQVYERQTEKQQHDHFVHLRRRVQLAGAAVLVAAKAIALCAYYWFRTKE